MQFRGSVSNLSDVEIASAEELVVYIPSEATRGLARLDHLAEKRVETSPMNVTGKDPIDTLDSEESTLEEDSEPADDLHNIILDKRGEDQPCPAGTAANSVMDPQVEDPEPADDLRNIILDKRGKDQPCPVGTAAGLVMDPQAEVVASSPSLDTATLPSEEALGEPTLPSSNLTETLETQDLGMEDAVVLLCE